MGGQRVAQTGRRIVKALLPRGVRAVLRDVVRYGPTVVRAWWVFKAPRPLLRHYFRHTTPADKRVRLRNGRELRLSHHRLDVVVLFQVFCERVYPTDRNTVIVDVGANIGLFSLYAALNGAAKVYAFEPNREAHGYMVENIQRNDLQDVIVPYNYAVTSRSDEVVLIPKAASPQNRIIRGTADPAEHDQVKTISLDDIVSGEGLSRVHLLKMDCEGSEYDILAGMSESTFAKIDRIIVEYHDGKVEQLEEKLGGYGFALEQAAPETAIMGMLWFRRRNGAWQGAS